MVEVKYTMPPRLKARVEDEAAALGIPQAEYFRQALTVWTAWTAIARELGPEVPPAEMLARLLDELGSAGR